MTQVQIDESFWELFPEGQVNVLVLHDINNTGLDSDKYQAILEDAEEQAKQYLTADVFSENAVVQSWRESYQAFKKKKGARASIEALLKRVSQGKGVGTINPLVDLYNSVSMRFAVPVGGEDLSAIEGDLHLGMAQGGEAFYPLGDDQNEPALPGEIIYSDAAGAVCRCLNWRDGKRTMLTETTTDAIMFMEATNALQKENLDTAMDSLQRVIARELGVEGTIYHLTAADPTITNI
ncbi:B3/4 domain-containing protein [Weissella minor]|uniref:B3/B4 domain-containing protein n=1 Tax=Weissella minor TaxID=1620 RepID=UPI001BB027A3|nr:B3/4 domain-containing protein [Weissella minor]MBS0949014.1 B3/4 domain-containing protein [Weissella minor]